MTRNGKQLPIHIHPRHVQCSVTKHKSLITIQLYPPLPPHTINCTAADPQKRNLCTTFKPFIHETNALI